MCESWKKDILTNRNLLLRVGASVAVYLEQNRWNLGKRHYILALFWVFFGNSTISESAKVVATTIVYKQRPTNDNMSGNNRSGQRATYNERRQKKKYTLTVQKNQERATTRAYTKKNRKKNWKVIYSYIYFTSTENSYTSSTISIYFLS